MMGRWSCASVVALSGLLAVAASASAECAWVLWSQVHNPSPGPWMLQTAYPGVKACARALDAREKEAKKAIYVTEDGRKINGIADRRAETDLFQRYGHDASQRRGGVAVLPGYGGPARAEGEVGDHAVEHLDLLRATSR